MNAQAMEDVMTGNANVKVDGLGKIVLLEPVRMLVLDMDFVNLQLLLVNVLQVILAQIVRLKNALMTVHNMVYA
jgi:hypothetical protein